ncbi:MAG: AAA family ATPase [Caldilineaceae bacterium]|nr:AAA family ATPase [Caldilineaceae bacterium]MBP8125453.1 AAA family ATPase [Caldilineaceae bacterium]MBP9075081.1 AAA family ATPase [Caldilineaceae bacterium]
MSNLILPSLEIQNFRAFRDLKIDTLGKVNLIVGKNSVGKTCLLEAIRLYAELGNPSLIRQLLVERDELPSSRSNRDRSYEDEGDTFSAIRNLFHGRRDLYDNPQPIAIGQIHRPNTLLKISTSWYVEELTEDRLRRWKRIEALPNGKPTQTTFDFLGESTEKIIPGLAVRFGSNSEQSLPINRVLDRQYVGPRSGVDQARSTYVSAQGLTTSEIVQLWENITLTDLEYDVVRSLQLIAPNIERINLVGSAERSAEQIVIVKLTDRNEPVPLKSMGEGLVRIFGIVLGLVNSQNGLFMVDEIESGLHFSVQVELWRLLFEVAKRLNVQIFATTHSWDCVEAFQYASSQAEDDEGVLVRLQRNGDGISSTLFNEKHLEIATREQIEIR